MDKEIILQVKDLHVRLDSQEILKNVSFTVKKGEALAVIGPNGAGKTVLFRALLGLIPFSGEVAWKNGVTLGYVPQKLYIEPSTPLTVKEFFLLKSKRFWFSSKSFSSHLNHELQLVGLPEKVLKKTVGSLSGGEQQRLMIAWAMLNHPDVLLFDEPTSGIDAGFEETVYTIMERVQKERGTTVLIISHDLNVVYHYANDVLCLNHKVVCQGHPSDVLNSRDLAKLYGESSFYHHAINH